MPPIVPKLNSKHSGPLQSAGVPHGVVPFGSVVICCNRCSKTLEKDKPLFFLFCASKAFACDQYALNYELHAAELKSGPIAAC